MPEVPKRDRIHLPLIGYAVVFFAIQSLATLGLYSFARSGLETFTAPAFGVFAIAVSVMAISFIPLQLARGRWAPILAVAAVFAAVLCPWLGLKFGAWSVLPLALGGPVGLVMAVICSKRLLLAHPWFLVLGATAFAAVRFIAVNGGQLTHIYAPEFMALGQPYLDTSFHAALTEMIGNFGVVSGGIDGLVPQFHHAGSHMWLASLSQIFGIPAIAVYPMAFQIFVVPCFSYFFLYAVASLQWVKLWNPVWAIVASLTVTSVSSWFFLDKLLLTESFSLALLLFFSAVPLLFVLLSKEEPVSAGMIPAVAAAAIVTPVLMAFKIPVGVMWAAAVTVVVVRRLTYPKWRRTVAAMLVFAVAGSAIILLLASVLVYRDFWTLLQPFDLAGGSRKYYLSDLAIILSVAAILAFTERHQADPGPEAAGTLAITGVLSALPGCLFALENVAYYFVNVASWLALIMLAARFACLLQKLAERSKAAASGAILLLIAVVIADPDRYVRFSIFLQRIAVLQEYGTTGDVGRWPHKRPFSQSLTTIGTVGAGIAEAALKLDSMFPADVAAAINGSLGARFVQQVRAAKAESGGRLVVFVPPSNTDFWMLNRDCRAQSFFVPAMTGVPMLMGLPPNGRGLHCVLDVTYGFGKYGPRSHSMELDTERLCDQALIRGFNEVFVLRSPDDRIVQEPPIECAP